MVKRVDELYSFNAKSSEGKIVRIHVLQEIIDVGTMDDPDAEANGLKKLVTSNGAAVNRLEKGKYQVYTGQMLTSDDPLAC